MTSINFANMTKKLLPKKYVSFNDSQFVLSIGIFKMIYLSMWLRVKDVTSSFIVQTNMNYGMSHIILFDPYL